MAAWLTVYCARSVASITAGDLLSLLKDLDDPWTLAETYGLDDDEAVDRALANLRIEPVTKPKGVKFSVYYKPGKSRPIQVHVWTGARLAEELEEAKELLATVRGPQVRRIRSRVAKSVEVVALELGIGQLEDPGIMLAGQMAEFLAAESDGVIRDQNDDWWP